MNGFCSLRADPDASLPYLPPTVDIKKGPVWTLRIVLNTNYSLWIWPLPTFFRAWNGPTGRTDGPLEIGFLVAQPLFTRDLSIL